MWESLIFHYRTHNDYYLPSLLLKPFSFFLVKNLFVLFKQHLFCQNVLTDFFLIDFFLKHEHDMQTFSYFQVFPFSSSLSSFKVGTRPEAAALSVQASTCPEATACSRSPQGKRSRNTTNLVSQLSLVHFTEQSCIPYFKPKRFKLLSLKAREGSFSLERLACFYQDKHSSRFPPQRLLLSGLQDLLLKRAHLLQATVDALFLATLKYHPSVPIFNCRLQI